MLPPRGRAEQGLAAVSPGLLFLEMWPTNSHVTSPPHSSLRTVIENCPSAAVFSLSKGFPGLTVSLGHASPVIHFDQAQVPH